MTSALAEKCFSSAFKTTAFICDGVLVMDVSRFADIAVDFIARKGYTRRKASEMVRQALVKVCV